MLFLMIALMVVGLAVAVVPLIATIAKTSVATDAGTVSPLRAGEASTARRRAA